MLSRKEFTEELKLREAVRRVIKIARTKKQESKRSQILNELDLRSSLRDLIMQESVALVLEGDKKLYPNTGLNKLSDAFGLTIEKIGDKYKALQTNEIQRRAFVVHLEAAFKNLESQLIAQDAASDEVESEINEEDEIKVKVEKEPFLFNKEEEEPIEKPEQDERPNISGKSGLELKKEIEKFFQEVPPTNENIDDWQEGRERAEEAWRENGWAFAEYFPRSKEDQSMYTKWRKENFKEFYKQWEDEIASPETVIDPSPEPVDLDSQEPIDISPEQDVFSEEAISDEQFKRDVMALVEEEEDFESFLSRIF